MYLVYLSSVALGTKDIKVTLNVGYPVFLVRYLENSSDVVGFISENIGVEDV